MLFYSAIDISPRAKEDVPNQQLLADAVLLAQLGGKEAGVMTRVKDFEVIKPADGDKAGKDLMIVTAGSDGSIRPMERLDRRHS